MLRSANPPSTSGYFVGIHAFPARPSVALYRRSCRSSRRRSLRRHGAPVQASQNMVSLNIFRATNLFDCNFLIPRVWRPDWPTLLVECGRCRFGCISMNRQEQRKQGRALYMKMHAVCFQYRSVLFQDPFTKSYQACDC